MALWYLHDMTPTYPKCFVGMLNILAMQLMISEMENYAVTINSIVDMSNSCSYW